MSNNLSLTIGQNTATVPIKLSNAQANAVLLRYCAVKGIPTEGRTPAQIGDDVLRSLMRYVRDVSLDQHRAELLAQQRAELEESINAANDLFDD